MHDYWWMWCFGVVVATGGLAGSFINMVIYRLPRQIPFGRPLWSFCPNCQTTIRWYDNIPVLSYFFLGGRCRACACRISPRYVIVEVVTLLFFVILFDAFFVSTVLDGISAAPWSVAYRFWMDWPIYVAHVVLFACLVAMSVIDMELYWVDIRFTRFAAIVGFVMHAVWTPVHFPHWPRPGSTLGGACLLAALGSVLTYWACLWAWRRRRSDSSEVQADVEVSDAFYLPQDPVGARAPAPEGHFPPSAWIAGLVLYLTIALLVAVLAQHPTGEPVVIGRLPERGPDSVFCLRNSLALAFIFVALLAGSMIPRPSDHHIAEALEAERPAARKVALQEFIWTLPAAACFLLGIFLVRPGGALHGAWQNLWAWELMRNAKPVMGLGTAAAGFMICAALGWTVRIAFTWILGKEAFGTGDIHIMAAAGAVAGWEVVVVGFFLANLLALFGWILMLPFKRSSALPMGPWLTLAIFLTVLFREPAVRSFILPIRFLLGY